MLKYLKSFFTKGDSHMDFMSKWYENILRKIIRKCIKQGYDFRLRALYSMIREIAHEEYNEVNNITLESFLLENICHSFKAHEYNFSTKYKLIIEHTVDKPVKPAPPTGEYV